MKTLEQASLSFFCLSLVLITAGCSGKLSRHEASKQISKMLEPTKLPDGRTIPGSVPGYELPFTDSGMDRIFRQGERLHYGDAVAIPGHPRSPDSEDYLVNALGKLGYISVQEQGPTSVLVNGDPLRYPQSRAIKLTSKVGVAKTSGYSEDFATGFSCYPPPAYSQCETPGLFESTNNFEITGIVQDETHAKVNILIPWKLTDFGAQLKPYAEQVAQNEKQFGIDSSFDSYPALYGWEHFLISHGNEGKEPAEILFQKFDDGWRIVDSNGKSLKDYGSK